MWHISDSGYQRLFKNKTIFRQLMQTFVPEKWVADLDFETAETLDKSFVSDHYKKTESDLIYKIKRQDQDIYIYVLLEFQSTVNRFMALRVLNYLTNFYMDFIQSGKGIKRLPAVFPIVLYNGDSKWSAATNLADLIEGDDILGRFSLKFEYFKIAENEYEREKLLKIGNIVSTLFLAEAHYDLTLLEIELLDLFDRESDREAVSLFLNWFKQLAMYSRLDPQDYDSLETIYKSKEDVKSMLITAIEKEKKDIFEKGIEKGKIEDAKVMLHENFEPSVISKITGLSEEYIQKLKSDL